MVELVPPTLREVLAGYVQFNEWGLEERRAILAALSVEDSIRQFFDLYQFVRPFRPDTAAVERAVAEKQAGWIALYSRLL